jgi:hypothetical protein|tara:strand:+ start:292 stop:615 length:324 start_codon:yes stop_codon:yes gene_type:complete
MSKLNLLMAGTLVGLTALVFNPDFSLAANQSSPAEKIKDQIRVCRSMVKGTEGKIESDYFNSRSALSLVNSICIFKLSLNPFFKKYDQKIDPLGIIRDYKELRNEYN